MKVLQRLMAATNAWPTQPQVASIERVANNSQVIQRVIDWLLENRSRLGVTHCP
jgi:ferredoxin-thioredoxin reductase catalytic subunit